MKADIVPLVVGFLIFIASLVSLKLGISVVIMEIILGVAAGSMGLRPEEWMLYLAGLGGILLTFLAGAEVDLKLMKKDFHKSFLIGFCSFLAPFVAGSAYTYFAAGWDIRASLIAGTALSETSIAVVYSILTETGLVLTDTGRLLLSATFITNSFTALALSVIFAEPTIYTAVFIVVLASIIKQAAKFPGVYFLARSFIPQGSTYVTLLNGTGLTFGLIAALFGLQAGYIDNIQYSALTAVLILSAILPTFVAQKWFMPRHSEYLLK